MNTLYVTFDIETTGAFLDKDLCFGVGYCVGYNQTDIIENNKFCLNLHKFFKCDNFENTKLEELKNKWGSFGYEKRCFEEFWSKNLRVLDKISNNANCSTEKEIFDKLNELMTRLENKYKNFVIIFDTVGYDSVWLTHRLQKYGYAQLTTNRDFTGYRSLYELDSYRLGIAKSYPEDFKDISKFKFEYIKNDQHDPAVDAYNIFMDFTFLINLVNTF